MPAALSYPGVYIEEVPSGVRTITGVATSITAFVGRAPRGPVNEPVLINGFGEYVQRFGGLASDGLMGYAVRDFFQNGGGQALIVRVYRPRDPRQTTAHLDLAGLPLSAASPGAWGNELAVRVDHDGIDDQVARRFGAKADELFNLTVLLPGPEGLWTAQERIRNVSLAAGARRRLDRVLQQESNLVRADKLPDAASSPPPTPPAAPAPAAPAASATRPAATGADRDDAPAHRFSGGTDSEPLTPDDYKGAAAEKALGGIYALRKADLFNLLCLPPDTRGGDTAAEVYQAAAALCYERRAMLIVDSPAAWSANRETAADAARKGLSGLGLSGTPARNAALYFPRVRQADPLLDGQIDTFAPCGIVAGLYCRTDTERGVWKAPAGLDAAISGIQELEVNLNDKENGTLNPLGINCLRAFPASGRVIWGARTLRGNDQLADEYKYVPVRRLALYIEESLYRGTQWAVFEPNDEPLWAQLRLNIGSFMHNLFRQGAFQGASPKDAYFVKCDKESTTQADINLGIVNVVVGFAPLKPAEFVVIKLQQMAGQIQS